MDKLGERLAFERGGTRLYELLITKCEASQVTADEKVLKSLKKIRREEAEHMAMVKEAIASLDPSLVVEALYLYRKPEIAAAGGWTEAERTALYNALTGIGSLKGIQYYSASRGRMRTLYESSYIVDGPEGRFALEDPVVALPPERATLYAVQKDLTFGEHRYRYDFQTAPGAFVFVQENLTELNYGIVPVLGTGRWRTVVLVADAGASLVIYAASAARTTLVPGIEGKVRESFANRADALYQWFSGRADAALVPMGAGR